MMRIPRIEPGGTRLTTQTGVAPKDPRSERRTSEAMGQFLEVSQKLAQKFEAINDKTEQLNAETEARKKHIELKQNVVNNPDEWRDKYQGELEKIKSETSEMISLPASRSDYGFSYDAMALSTKVSIDNTIRKNDIRKRQTAIFDNVDVLEVDYIDTNSPDMKVALLEKMRDEFKEGAKDGAFTPIQARSNIEAQEKKFVETDIKNDMAIDLDEAERKIIAGEYPLVASGEKESYLKIIDTARAAKERKQAKEHKANQIIAGRELGMKLLKGEADIVDVIDQANDEIITPEIAKSAWKYLTFFSGQKYMQTDEEAWNYILEKALDPEMDMEKFYGILFEAKLSGKDAEMFLDWAHDGYNYIDNYKPREPRWEYFDNVMKSMKDFVGDLYSSKDASRALHDMTRTLFEQVNSGTTPTDKIAEKGKELMGQEIIKSVKGANNLPKDGGIYIDANGNRIKMYPDGRLEEIE